MGEIMISAVSLLVNLLIVWHCMGYTDAQGCNGCQSTSSPSGNDNANNVDPITREEREFRTNLVKLKILKALGLESPPNVTSPISTIPQSFEDMSFEYAPKEQQPALFLIGRTVSDGCLWNQTACCFYFRNEESMKCGIKSETLWVYMQVNVTNDIRIYENHSNGFMASHRIVRDKGKSDGWVAIDLQPRLEQLMYRNFSFISYLNDSDAMMQCKDLFGKHTPLLAVSTEDCGEAPHRQARNTITESCPRTRSSGEEPECCLQQFVVNFTTIGWNNWIRAPPTFSANYCRGKCNLRTMVREYDHRNMMYLYGSHLRMNRMLPCCVPVQRTFLQAIVYHSSNHSLGSKVISGISASACECF